MSRTPMAPAQADAVLSTFCADGRFRRRRATKTTNCPSSKNMRRVAKKDRDR